MAYQYLRKVQYHETDKMGITHHANYINWMEEARIDFLEQVGYSYARLESEGIFSPVLSVECQYKQPTTFNDQVTITITVEEFKGVRLVIGYEMVNAATGATVLTGKSTHCFTDCGGKPVVLKRKNPELDALLRTLAKGE